MILLLMLLTPVAAELGVEVAVGCDTCLLFGEKCYNVQYLYDLEVPFRNRVVIHKMGILRSTNTLFFSFEPKIEDPEYYKVGFLNLEDPGGVVVIAADQKVNFNFGTFDIDQDNGVVYLGGSDGVFALDMNQKKLIPYSSRGDMITNLFFKNYVYFTRYDDRGIVVKMGDNFRTIFEYASIRKFVVNKYNIVVFSTNHGLHVGKGDLIHLVSDNAYFRGLTMDLDDNVYAWWIDGIYKVIVDRNIIDSRIEKVADLPDIGTMTFDNKNNILLTFDKGLYSMTQSSFNCSRGK